MNKIRKILDGLDISYNPDEQPGPPERCYGCGKSKKPEEVWELRTVDFDPGDPEVGPDPQLEETEICPDCIKNWDEVCRRGPRWEQTPPDEHC